MALRIAVTTNEAVVLVLVNLDDGIQVATLKRRVKFQGTAILSDDSCTSAKTTYVFDLVLQHFDIEVVFATSLPPITVFLVDLDAISWSLAEKYEFISGIEMR